MKQRSKLTRALWAAGGVVSFGLGALGSVLPILPTTPLILLAAFCFARSSDKLNNWFKGTKLYEKVLEGYVTKRQMTVKAKLSIILPVTVLMGIGFALMGRVPIGRVILFFVWLGHLVYFGFVVKTDSEASSGAEADLSKRQSMPMMRTELFDLLADAKKYIWMQVGWKALALASQIVIALSAAWLVQRAFEIGVDETSLLLALAIVVAGVAVRVISDRNESRTAYLASVDVKRILRGKIYAKLLRLGASYRESTSTSKVVQLAVEGVEQLETYFSLFIPQFFYALLAPVALFLVVGALVSWKVAAVLLVFVPLIPVSIAVVQTVAKRLLSKYWGQYTQLGDTFLENLQGLTTLKIYEADEQAAQRMDRDSESFRIATMNVLKMQLNSTTVMDIGAYGGAAVGMAVALSEMFAGQVSVGGVLAVLLLAAEFFLPMRRLGSYFHVGMNGMAASDSIFDLLDLPERARGAVSHVEDTRVSFSLENVSFSYESERDVLDDVSMEFPTGSLTSIVGPSGCGKSTVASLLMGRNRSYRGRISINGREMADVGEESLMDCVTLVSRASHLFKGTVRDNLMLAAPQASDDELVAALAVVRLADFVNAQGGLDFPVAEGGANLSGGQRQRLVLARALLHDTPAYIFDEATSSIDVESEEVIMQVVRELALERTVVLISHRLANVVGSDAIYVLDNGHVVEHGTHEELLAEEGNYSRLFNSQKELEAFAGNLGNTSVSGVEALQAADDTGCNVAHDVTPLEGGVPQTSRCDSALSIMGRLIVLVKSMAPIMCLAIALGVVGFLCAIFLTVFAGFGMMQGASQLPSALSVGGSVLGQMIVDNRVFLFALLIGMAVARGLLHYGEQYCNHYIAFKMLAMVRHKVFAKLRTLAPAKLEGRDKGDLISLITSDIELLEVFYAHTISPIAIATLVSVAMIAFLSSQHWVAGLIGLVAYAVIGIVLPIWNSRRVGDLGLAQRNEVASLNAFMLDSLYGLDETIQYGSGRRRASEIDARSQALSDIGGLLNRMQCSQVALTDLLIQLFSWGMLFAMLLLTAHGATSFSQAVISTLALMGSFGPVVALSNLSTTLSGTLASGQRVLDLLEETPQTRDVDGCKPCVFGDVSLADVSFSYADERILERFTLRIPKGSIVGVHGPSGSGKSTICKLIMRFWDADEGTVCIGEREVCDINTRDLRSMESYVTQETWLFHESIADNIAVGKSGATRQEIAAAAQKASLHDFVSLLPEGYDTMVGELGDTLSDGERQRIGLARAFLHDAPLMLLDEPTSNLDSLNEAIILQSLSRKDFDKTVMIVSHRASTMGVADTIVEMDTIRAS